MSPDLTLSAEAPDYGAGLDVVEQRPLWREAGLDPEQLAQAAVAAAGGEAGVRMDRAAAVVFADDAVLRRLNATHRGKDQPTNVLAFPAAEAPGAVPAPLGDVILAFETIAREAEKYGIPLAARSLHMVVHGYLHLVGYDHQTEAEAELMESVERRSLARLQIADPYEVRDDG